MNLEHDLFGTPIVERPVLTNPPLTGEQIQSAMSVLPDQLLEQLENTLENMRADRLRQGRTKAINTGFDSLSSDDQRQFKLSSALKRFLAEMFWIFDLGPTYFPFEAACSMASDPVDPEVIRNGVSVAFGDEIRMLYRLLEAYDPHGAKPMAKKLGYYVTLH